MGRIGIAPEEGVDFIEQLKSLQGIKVQGLMTHFADADLGDKQFSSSRWTGSKRCWKRLKRKGSMIPLRHAANSAALLDYRRALFTMVRPGIMLYGYNPLQTEHGPPACSRYCRFFHAHCVSQKSPSGVPISYGRTYVTRRQSLIATIPIGYADGYSRGLQIGAKRSSAAFGFPLSAESAWICACST